MKAMLFGMLRRARVPVLAVTLVALVLVATPVALAANGKPFILGKGNLATKVTKLTGKVASGAALLVINPSGGPALDLRVKTGKAPMKVNSATKVSNLNADQLDGQDSSAFLPARTYSQEENTVASPATGNNYFPACGAGDVAISGGYSNLATTSSVLRNERYGPDPKVWAFGIYNSSQTPDAITVKVVCIDLE